MVAEDPGCVSKLYPLKFNNFNKEGNFNKGLKIKIEVGIFFFSDQIFKICGVWHVTTYIISFVTMLVLLFCTVKKNTSPLMMDHHLVIKSTRKNGNVSMVTSNLNVQSKCLVVLKYLQTMKWKGRK